MRSRFSNAVAVLLWLCVSGTLAHARDLALPDPGEAASIEASMLRTENTPSVDNSVCAYEASPSGHKRNLRWLDTSVDFSVNGSSQLVNGAHVTELDQTIGNSAAEFHNPTTFGGNTVSFAGAWTCSSGGSVDVASGCSLDLVAASLSPSSIVSAYFGAGAILTDGTLCTPAVAKTINSGPRVMTINCSSSSSATLYGNINMPDSYDADTVTFEMHAMNENATPSGVLDFDFSCQCRRDDDTLNSSWGGVQNVSVSFASVTQYDEKHDTTAAVTCNGTCAAGNSIYWRAVMDSGTTSTQLSDTYILGVKMEFGVDALSD